MKKLSFQNSHLEQEIDGSSEVQKETLSLTDEVLDGGYGWLICAVGFVIQFVVLGVHNAFGILYVSLLRDFNTSPADTAWIGSMAIGMNFLCGPVTSSLCQRFGCRIVGATGGMIAFIGILSTAFVTDIHLMYITYGFVWGVGSSLCYAPSLFILGQYFNNCLAIANGIVTAGSGIGTLALGPLIKLCLDYLGWQKTLLIISGFMLLIVASALLYKTPRTLVNASTTDNKFGRGFCDSQLWGNKAFIFWLLALCFFFMGYFVPFVHLMRHAESIGIPGTKGSLLIGYLSISSTIGRLGFGFFSDHPRVNRLLCLQASLLMMAISTTLCPLASSYSGLILYVVVFGVFDGCFVLFIAVITGDIVGRERTVPALGIVYGIIATPMTLGPPIAGWIYEATDSYQDAFYVSGGAIALGACVLFLVPLCMSRDKENKATSVFTLDKRARTVSNLGWLGGIFSEEFYIVDRISSL